MRDICEHHFFIRDGRDAVQSWIGSIQDHSQILAVVPVFQPELTLEANIANLSDAGYIEGKWWHQRCYIYSGDDAILVLVTSASYRKIFEAHLAFVASKYHQKGYCLQRPEGGTCHRRGPFLLARCLLWLSGRD